MEAHSEEHVADRVVERFYRNDASRKDDARRLVQRVRAALADNAPQDWRFTRHPSARFLVSLVVTGAAGAAAKL
jgi:hypothetical protein